MQAPRLSLRQLQVFCAVARTGSTTAASRAIALSQSATSASINELENALSLRLFDRIGKRLLLNDNGRALQPRARAMLQGALDIEHMARHDHLQMQELRIGASTTIGNYLLPRLLRGFLGKDIESRSPSWRSTTVIGNTAAICAAVARFELDIGLIEGPCHLPALAVTPWAVDQLVIVQSAGRSAASGHGRRRLDIRALREMTWLLREPGSGTREATDELLLPHLRTYRRSIELGSSEAIKHAVAEGIGIACLSRWVVRDMLESRQLAEVRTTLPSLTRRCHWVVHRDKQRTAAMQRFIALLAR